MFRIVPLKQREAAWHKWREGKISASLIPTIMGLNPKKSPLMLYNQIMSGESDPVNPAMQRGIDLEDKARKWAEAKLNFEYPEACIERTDDPYFIASLDGYNDQAPFPILEIKCPGENIHHQAKLGIVPHWYFGQLQWQLWVTGADKMIYCSFDGEDGEIIEVKRDEKFMEKAISAATKFLNCLRSFEEPDPMPIDFNENQNRDHYLKVKELFEIKKSIKSLEDKEGALEKEVREICNEKSTIFGEFKYRCYKEKGRIEYSKIPELENIDLEKYRKSPTVKWRLT